MKKLSILIFSVLVLLQGCSTPYGKYSYWNAGGYKDSMLTDDMALITFQSSRGDAEEAVIIGVMRRAAELTLEKGYTGFMVMKEGGETNEGVVSTGGTFNAFSTGGMTTGSYSPMLAFYKKGTYQATIRMVNSSGNTVFDARQVMSNTAAQFE